MQTLITRIRRTTLPFGTKRRTCLRRAHRRNGKRFLTPRKRRCSSQERSSCAGSTHTMKLTKMSRTRRSRCPRRSRKNYKRTSLRTGTSASSSVCGKLMPYRIDHVLAQPVNVDEEDEVPDWLELGARVEIDGDTCDDPEFQQVVGQQGVVTDIDASDVRFGYRITVQFDEPIFFDSDDNSHYSWKFKLAFLKKAEEEPQEEESVENKIKRMTAEIFGVPQSDFEKKE
eukprot:m.360765 g.360765  ORF g.360765 m.360765 type:complete len:228 (-) comp16644_c0_seq17:34-717(-)